MPTIEQNKFWDEKYNWSKHGDEWDDQSSFCKQPYEKWKNSIAENFINNNIGENSTVLEIAPGHGRWTEFIVKKAKKIILVELNPKCIEFCKNRFKDIKNIKYFVNNGKDLSFISDGSVDFIWSYDSFVHIEADIIDAYFRQFFRILKNDGCAIIHHSGRKNSFLWTRFLKHFFSLGKKSFNYLTLKKFDALGGWRSDVSRELIKKIAENNNLKIINQIDSWGINREYNIKLYRDYLTILRK